MIWLKYPAESEVSGTDPYRIEVYEKDPRDKIFHEGYELLRFSAVCGEREIAYLKVAYIPRERWDSLYPTPLHFQARMRGWTSLVGPLEQGDTLAIARAARRYDSWYGREQEITEAEAEEVIRSINHYLQPQYDSFESSIVDSPYVDYVKVASGRKRQGIATSLYEYANTYFRDRGLIFRSSTLQSDEAEATWEALCRRGRAERVVVEEPGRSPRKFYRFKEIQS